MAWEPRVDAKHIALQVEAAKAEDYGLPQRTVRGDADATGGVRVEVEVGRRRRAQIAQRHVRIAQIRRDQRVHSRAKRTAVCTPRLIETKILLRGRVREFFG